MNARVQVQDEDEPLADGPIVEGPIVEGPTIDGTAPSRHASLIESIGVVTARSLRALPADVVLLVAGSILFPAGIALILLGWSGAASTPRLYDQIDYLISGGLLGLALAVAGCFAYFGYWLIHLIRDSRRQASQALQALRRIESSVEGVARAMQGSRWNGRAHEAEGSATPPVPGSPAEARATPASRRTSRSAGRQRPDTGGDHTPGVPMLVATPKGSLLHRPECPVVAGKPGARSLPAGTQGFRYCTMCDAEGALG